MTTPDLFNRPAEMTVPGHGLELAWAGSWVFRLPRELRTVNDSLWGHWRNLQRERQHWEQEFHSAIAAFKAVRDVAGWSGVEHRAFAALCGQRERRCIRVFRFVPHRRNFIRDPSDNMTGKHLVDAMKHVGLVHDDSRRWLERGPIEQFVSPDGKFWTVVKLDRPDVRSAWRQ